MLTQLQPVPNGLTKDQVIKALDRIRPHFHADGGDIEVVEIIEGQVRLRLKGNCRTCNINKALTKAAVVDLLERAFPDELTNVWFE